MEKGIRILAVVLVAQLLLAVGLSYTGPNLAAHKADKPMLSVDQDKVDHLTIEGPDKAKVVLAKVDGTWHLPDNSDFPADGDKVSRLLTKLKGLKQGAAVATSAGAQERFKVSDTKFERRITLANGDTKLATLYLGTTPSVRHIHARTAKEDAVYAVQFAAFDAPATANMWEDHNILQFPKATVKTVEVDNLHLQAKKAAAPADNAKATSAKSGATHPASPLTWQADGLPQGEQLKGDAANKLVGLLAKLRVGAVLGREAKAGYGLDKPVFQATVTYDDDKRVEYRLGKTADKEEYTLKSSLRPEYFRVPSYVAKPLIAAAKLDTLVASATPGDKGTTLKTAQSPKQ